MNTVSVEQPMTATSDAVLSDKGVSKRPNVPATLTTREIRITFVPGDLRRFHPTPKPLEAELKGTNIAARRE